MLAAVRADPGLTRVALAGRLGLSSASTTETLARLRAAGWVREHRAPVTGRGRPTTVVEPDPHGPAVVAVDLRHEDWTCASARLDGGPTVVRTGRHGRGGPPGAVLDAVREAVAAPAAGCRRAAAVGVAVPAPVVGDAPAPGSDPDWADLDLDGLRAAAGDAPVLVDNDATLAGVAESRTGAAVGASTALHLMVENGLGGVLLLGGRPHRGRSGAAGEFGHLPFGDPGTPCPCGARGCWGREVDGTALVRHLGEAGSGDPRGDALAVLARAAEGDGAARRAVDTVVAALGRGVAGLVNAHDPDVVVLGGLAPRLRAAAGPSVFATAFSAGLMRFRRDAPCPVRDAVHGDGSALHGAAALALDHATSAEGLARAETRAPHPMLQTSTI